MSAYITKVELEPERGDPDIIRVAFHCRDPETAGYLRKRWQADLAEHDVFNVNAVMPSGTHGQAADTTKGET